MEDGDAPRGGPIGWRSEPELRSRIVAALSDQDLASPEAAEEAAFHLTDWIDELRALCDLYRAERWDVAQAVDVIYSFLAHAPHHVAAAHRVLYGTPVTDVFELGAVEGSGEARRQPGEPYAPNEGPPGG